MAPTSSTPQTAHAAATPHQAKPATRIIKAAANAKVEKAKKQSRLLRVLESTAAIYGLELTNAIRLWTGIRGDRVVDDIEPRHDYHEEWSVALKRGEDVEDKREMQDYDQTADEMDTKAQHEEAACGDLPDTELQQRGSAPSRGTTERYTGGTKDSLFGGGGRQQVPRGLRESGGGGGDDPNKNDRGNGDDGDGNGDDGRGSDIEVATVVVNTRRRRETIYPGRGNNRTRSLSLEVRRPLSLQHGPAVSIHQNIQAPSYHAAQPDFCLRSRHDYHDRRRPAVYHDSLYKHNTQASWQPRAEESFQDDGEEDEDDKEQEQEAKYQYEKYCSRHSFTNYRREVLSYDEWLSSGRDMETQPGDRRTMADFYSSDHEDISPSDKDADIDRDQRDMCGAQNVEMEDKMEGLELESRSTECDYSERFKHLSLETSSTQKSWDASAYDEELLANPW